jgi:CheY-like chemotaxis protein
MSHHGCDDNENERRIFDEFRDEVRDTVSELTVLIGNLRSRAVSSADGLGMLRRDASNLRSQGHALGVPLIKLVTHRLDEYIAELKDLGEGEISEIEVFLGKIEKLVDGEAVSEAEVPNIVRSLPAKRNADVDFKIELKDIEILLAVPEKAMSHILERELANCGYRTSVVRDGFEAIETIVRTKPDMVIAALELGVLSGVDLGCALAAMGPTSGVPYAVLTSYEWGHAKLKGLPPRAGVIRKGSKFGDDLAETLARFGIT